MGEGVEAQGVELDAYEIARCPMTVEEYARFVDDAGAKPLSWDTRSYTRAGRW